MFSVPGWSITAPLKTQTGPAQAPSLLPEAGAKSQTSESSKKRKRKDGGAEDVKAKKPKSVEQTSDVQKSDHVNKKEHKKTKKLEDEPWPTSEKRDKKAKKEKPKGTGSNAVDIDESAIARLEKAKKREEKAERAKKFMDDASQPSAKAEADSKADSKMKKKRKKHEDAQSDLENEVHIPVNGASKSSPSKVEEVVSKESKQASKEHKKASKEPKEEETATSSKSKMAAAPKLTPLQAQMAAKLASARFRHLNETLYTTPSSSALKEFEKNPATFEEYHSGFRQQVEVWPSNPVDGYISDIRRRGAVKLGQKDSKIKALPRTKGLCTIADLGCGDAKLASEMGKGKENLNVKILSYDLHSPSPLVERADVANLPLEDGSVNVAMFCLALMGTNWPDFIDEAYRILHWKGELWIAEIKSRFGRVEGKKDGSKGKVVEHSVGNRKKKPRSKMSEAEKKRDDAIKADEDTQLVTEVDGVPSSTNKTGDETDVSTFIKILASRGFVLDGEESEAVERGNKMFVKMRFLKAAHPTKGKNVQKGKEGATWKPKGKKFLEGKEEDIDESKVLKPCVYKLR